ncbi:MAG: SCO family protein [Bacteroidetes bacterium]|nr:SCO family protein [Bacteroidota bacterium]MBX7046948.1 SCO family protein [Ignavibacteria bacterium]
MKKVNTLCLLLLVSFLFVAVVKADESNTGSGKKEVGIDEKTGQFVPLDIVLFDEKGEPHPLKDYLNGKPTIISLIYFRCPGICSPLSNGLAEVVDRVDLEAGKDYNIISVSFNPLENYIMASEKKQNYYKTLKTQLPQNGWQFLTADSVNIAKICDALGFYVKKEGNDFAHGAAIMAVSPDGKIARYLFGTEFNPFDFKLAIMEASEGRTGTSIAKIVQFCFSYNPDAKGYVLNITRVAGGGILLLLIIFSSILFLKKKKTNLIIEDKTNG